jgi:hypothetical protein
MLATGSHLLAINEWERTQAAGHQTMRLLTRASSTGDQRIKTSALMAIVITFDLIHRLGGFVMHLRFAEPKAEPSKSRDRAWF